MKKFLKIAVLAMTMVMLLAVCVSAEGVITFNQPYLWIDGEPSECTATVTDGDYTIKSVTWNVASDAVSVDANGKVTALKAGTGDIVAFYTYEVPAAPVEGEGTPAPTTVKDTAYASIEVKQNALVSITAEVKSAFVDKQAITTGDFEVTGSYADGKGRPITNFTIDKTEAAAPSTEVTISVGNITTKKTLTVTKIDPETLVKSVEISAPAANTEYKVGDTLNASSVELKVTDIYGGVSYKKVDGTSVKWSLGSGTSYTFSTADATKGYINLKVSYAGKSASVNVKVVAATPTESTFTITYTAGTTAKTTFLVGDKFDGTGYKFKITENGKDITSKCSNLKITAYTFDDDEIGKNVSIDLNASFTYNDKTEKATITITGLTVLEEAEELDIYEIDTVVLKSDKYAVGYEFDPDKLENDVDYIKVVLYEDRKTSKTTKIYADDFEEYDNDFDLVVLDANGKAKSSRNRHTIEEDDVYTKSGKDMVHLLFTADTETFAIEVSVGDSGVKFYYDGELITGYDDIEDALYYTTKQDKNVDTDDFDLDDLKESKPIVLKLGEDKKVSSTYDFDPEHNIEIDLNGHSLTFYSDTIDISRDNKNYTVTIKNTSSTDATFIYSDKKINITLKKGDTLVFEYGNDLPGFITVTVEWDKNGAVTEKTNNIKTITTTSGEIQIGKGTTLTFTIRPNTGYEIKSVTVDGVSVIPKTTTASSDYIVSSTGIATYTMKNITKKSTLAVTFTEKKAEEKPAKTAWENPFTDISSRNNYYSAVEFVCTNNLFNGVSATKFAPENTMTRAMFVTVLGRLAAKTQNIDFSQYTNSSFSDVSASNPQNGYAAPYIEWAARNNLVEGYGDGTFGPNNNITHQQMYLIMQRYASFIEHKYTDASQTTLNVSDASSVASWALNGVKYAQQQGLLITSGGRVDPTGNALRWELATELMLFCKNVLGWTID